MKHLFTLLLLFFFGTNSAQDSYLFKIEYQENTEYRCVYTSQSLMTREGYPLELQSLIEDKEIRNQSEFIIKTSTENEDGRIPYQQFYVVAEEESASLNNVDVLSDLRSNMVITGYIEKGSKIVMDTILGLDPELVVYQSYKRKAKNDQFNIPFPENPMKIGDSFTWSHESSGIIQKYTLAEVVNQVALFEFTGTKKNDPDSPMLKSFRQEGVMKFDLVKNFVSEMQSEMIFVNDQLLGDDVVTFTAKVNSNQLISIE